MASAWEQGRPIYLRLPREAGQYQGNETCEWVTRWVDAILMEIKAAIENFEVDFVDPTTARSAALDWLGQYHGFSEEYAEPTADDAIKRKLIADAQSFIWANKGRPELMEYLLETFGINGRLYLVGSFLADIHRADLDLVGGEPLYYFILLPLNNGYLRTSPEWKLVEKLDRLYMPCYVRSRVCYEELYADFSVADDPVLS